LDGDGHLDLAVTREVDNHLSVFWNRAFDPVRFRRGDANGDGRIDISDAVGILTYLFLGGVEPGCLSALDANGDGNLVLTDAVYLLLYLFGSGPAPSQPFPGCGMAPISGPLTCAEGTGRCGAEGP